MRKMLMFSQDAYVLCIYLYIFSSEKRKKNAYEFYQQLSPSLIYSSTFSKWKSFFSFFLLLFMLRVLEPSVELCLIVAKRCDCAFCSCTWIFRFGLYCECASDCLLVCVFFLYVGYSLSFFVLVVLVLLLLTSLLASLFLFPPFEYTFS